MANRQKFLNPKQMIVQVDESEMKIINQAAHDRGLTRNDFVRMVLLAYIKNQKTFDLTEDQLELIKEIKSDMSHLIDSLSMVSEELQGEN